MNRFFVDVDGRDIGTDISITGGDVNHIKNVLRLKVGQEITVSNGRGREYIGAWQRRGSVPRRGCE